jgi:hypothetical protein
LAELAVKTGQWKCLSLRNRQKIEKKWRVLRDTKGTTGHYPDDQHVPSERTPRRREEKRAELSIHR